MTTSQKFFEFNQTAAAELPTPPPEPPSECPRCGSTNTKFCYYNNYNKSQPRHFCKACKRHWTKGGALRNVPAGRRRRANKLPHPYTAAAPPPPPPQKKNKIQNLLSLSTNQKNMSDILYQALIHSSSSSLSTTDCIDFSLPPHGTILESSGTTHAACRKNPDKEFTFTFPSSNYYQSSNDSTTEESTVTTSAAPPWTAAEVAGLWSWDDQIDSLASSSDFNIVWDNLQFDF